MFQDNLWSLYMLVWTTLNTYMEKKKLKTHEASTSKIIHVLIFIFSTIRPQFSIILFTVFSLILNNQNFSLGMWPRVQICSKYYISRYKFPINEFNNKIIWRVVSKKLQTSKVKMKLFKTSRSYPANSKVI